MPLRGVAPQLAFSTAWPLGRIEDSVTSQTANAGPATTSPSISESNNAYLVFMSKILSALGGQKSERTAIGPHRRGCDCRSLCAWMLYVDQHIRIIVHACALIDNSEATGRA